MAERAQRPLAPPVKSSEDGAVSTPLLIDAKAAAAMLAIGARTLWTYTNCRAIPSRKIGRAVRYCPDELRAWIAAGCPTDAGAADGVRSAMQKGARR